MRELVFGAVLPLVAAGVVALADAAPWAIAVAIVAIVAMLAHAWGQR